MPVNLNSLGQTLGLTPPTPQTKAEKRANEVRNRAIRHEELCSTIKAFARMNGQDPTNFGLAKIKVNGAYYYYGITCIGGILKPINIKFFPTAGIDDLLDTYVITRYNDCVGVMNHGIFTDPVIAINDGKGFKTIKWVK